MKNLAWFALLLALLWLACSLVAGCAEININVREGATATIRIEQDRTVVETQTDATLPLEGVM